MKWHGTTKNIQRNSNWECWSCSGGVMAVGVGIDAEVAVASGGVVAVGVGVAAGLHAATKVKIMRAVNNEKVSLFIVFDPSFF
jgi:hypothetical protein